MHEHNLAPGFERRNSQQTVIDEDTNPFPDFKSYSLTDMNVGSSQTVYRSLYAEQMFHLTKYVDKLAQYPNTEVMLIFIRDEPSENNLLTLSRKNVFTFTSLKLQPLLTKIERDPRFRCLSNTVNPQGNTDLPAIMTPLSYVLLGLSLFLSLTVLASVLVGMVLTTTAFVSFLSLFLWCRIMAQRKSPTEYQRLDDEMDQESVSHGSHKEDLTSSHLPGPAKQAEVTNLEAAITSLACDISTNGAKLLFHLECEEHTFDYGSSDLRNIFAHCRNTFSVEEEEPQSTARRLDRRIDYMVLCVVFSTFIAFDIAVYYQWSTVENIEVFGVSAFYCMIFNVNWVIRLLYMCCNGIQ